MAKEPDRTSFEAPYIARRPNSLADSSTFSANQWRRVIARSPIVRDCISTLILQVAATPYDVVCEDEVKRAFYLSVLDHANDEGFIPMLTRTIRDTLEIPFGGAWEAVRYPDGTLYNIYHVDGGCLAPTYDPNQPFVEVDPQASYNRVFFEKGQIVRISWLLRSELVNYGWTITPVMDCYPAIEALVRADVFYNTLLSDTPPPGVLDLLDFSREEAEVWVKSFRELFEGIDRFKVPVLYDHKVKAEFIPFMETSVMKDLPEIVRRYAEQVTAAFGMSIVDLGLYEYSQTKAGSVAQLNASKRQGLGALFRTVEAAINGQIFPDDVHFKWMPVDAEDSVRKAQAQKLRVEAFGIMVDKGIVVADDANKMLAQEGIITAVEAAQMGIPKTAAKPILGDEEIIQNSDVLSPEVAQEMWLDNENLPLTHLVLDDLGLVRYDWEECEDEIIMASETGWPNLKWAQDEQQTKRLYQVFLAEFRRISKVFSTNKLRQIIDAVWDYFPEPKDKVVQSADYDPIWQQILDLVGNEDTDLSDSTVNQVMSILNTAYTEGLSDAADNIWNSTPYVKGPLGLSFNLTNPETMEMLKQNTVNLAGNVNAGTKSLVARLIYSGVKSGKALYGSKNSVAADLNKALPNIIGKRRAQSIALFEGNKVQSMAHLKQYETFGLEQKHWVSLKSVACPICLKNDSMGFVSMKTMFNTCFGPSLCPPAHPTVCHCRLAINQDEIMAKARSGELFTFFDGENSVPINPKTGRPSAGVKIESTKTTAQLHDELKAIYKQKGQLLETKKRLFNEKKAELDGLRTQYDTLVKSPTTYADGRKLYADQIYPMVKELAKLQDGVNAEMLKVSRDLRKALFVNDPSTFNVLSVTGSKGELSKKPMVDSVLEDLGKMISQQLGITNNNVGFDLKGRSRANYYRNVLHLGGGSGEAVIAHESGHWIEDLSSEVHQAALDYRQSRIGPNDKSIRLKDINPGYRASERTIPDKWKEAYTGKLYPNDKYTEVISMGIETLYKNPLGFADEDFSFFSFMVNTLRGEPWQQP